MNPLHVDQLARLAAMAAESIGSNENNVKYKFIIPFLEAFGYERDLDFEHAAQKSLTWSIQRRQRNAPLD